LKILTDDPRYHRDSHSNALIAKDLKALEKHRLRLKQINDLKNETKEINSLKKDVDELKMMMRLILDKLNNEENNGIIRT